MQISKIKFKNFKMFKEEEFNFSFHTNVEGDNGTGKSSIVDGFFWLFFGKSSTGISDLEFVKPIIDGKVQRGLETSVSCTIDGVEYTRILKEKWVKRRGHTDREYEGNETKYKVDGVPAKQNEFKARISELFGDVEQFRLLSSPSAIPTLKWDKMRALLVSETTDLEQLQEQLKKYKAQRKDVADTVEALPIRIDEASESVSDSVEYDEDELKVIEADIDELKHKKKNLLENSGSEYKDMIHQKEIEIAKLESDITKGGTDHEREVSQRISELQAEISEYKTNHIAEYQSKYKGWKDREVDISIRATKLGDELRAKEGRKLDLEKGLDDCREKYLAARDCNWSDHSSCKECGQTLPEDAKQDFNIRKSAKLQELDNLGRETAAEIKALKEKITLMLKKVDDVNVELQLHMTKKPTSPGEISFDNDEEIKRLQGFIDEQKAREYNPSPVLAGKLSSSKEELATLKSKAMKAAPNTDEDIKAIDDSIADLLEKAEKQREAQQMIKVRETQLARVEDLKNQLQKESKQLVEIEKQIMKTEDKIVKAVEAAEEALNSRFSFTAFKLFDVQINGGIRPVCVPTVNGIEYDRLNTAMKIDCGIDIINTLSKEMNLCYPVFIDNAESSTKIKDTVGQSIFLYVKKDSQLTVKEA